MAVTASTINLMMGESYDEDLLSAYISQAQQLCAKREYSLSEVPDDIDYDKYDDIVLDAVIIGCSIRGAEGETQHSENGILRGFKYADMRDYIEAHIIPYVVTL